ncbi:uncharacterized protein AAGF69_014043 isoform 1-T1 [Amazona ochrocephala]
MAGRTVRVGGLPADLPPDRVADKLTIHFLRSRNGGGEIADVKVLRDGSRACALITFETPEVAQRILKVKNHVLSIGGEKYLLEVTAHTAELSPDEIFIYASVIVDYGKLPTGKALLRSLYKGYSNVQLHFDSKNAHCIVKGPFTELQAFSRDLLGSLNLKSQAAGETLVPDSSHVAKETRMPDPQQEPDSAESAQDTAKLPNWDQACEEAGAAPSPWGPVDGKAVEHLEDFSLVVDSDIYLYMQRFCAAEYQGVLQQHRVDVVDVSNDGIAMLYFQPAAGMAGDMGALQEARLALQKLYQQLEGSLRKEKITKGGLDLDSQALRALTHELQKLYPQLLCHEDVKQLYLIGNLVDVSEAKQYVQDFSARRGAAQAMVSSSLPAQPTTSHPAEDTLHKPKEPAGTSAPRLSSKLRGELQLPASFSTLKAERSWDPPAVGQALPSGNPPPQTDALSPSDPTALTPRYRPGVSTAAVDLGSAAESQQKDPKEWDQMKGGARLTRHKALSAFGGKGNRDSGGSGPIKHYSLASTSSAFDTRTSKPSESKPLLQRSSSFSLPRSKGSEKRQDTGSGGGRVSEEMSLDSLQWSYLKDVHRAAVAELCSDGGVQLSEHRAGDCTVLTLQAEDREKLFQAKWKVEALVQKCPDLVCQSLSYAELAVDGPDDSALSELCSLLRGNSFQVGFSKDKDKLYLACPKEMLPGVSEAFQVFSSGRLPALKSPGPESTGYPSAVQPSRSQDTVLGAALSGSLGSLQMDPQDLTISDKAELADVLRAKTSPSLWRLKHTLGQEEANDCVDSGTEQGGGDLLSPGVVDKSSPTGPKESQEQQKTKLPVGEPDTARPRQVLLGRFQFAWDKSRGGHGEAMGRLRSPAPAADGAPHSLPARLCRPTEAAALAPDRAPLPAGRSSVQEGQTRGPSPGQESSMTAVGRCDACHGSAVTCPARCGHSLCRTCFAGDSTQPPCCSVSTLTPGCRIPGKFQVSSLSQSLPGYYRDPTLQVVYIIPDGVQGVGDPHPGQPYKGGHFRAFLPDNREGQKTAVLLKKAFDCGLTFHIKSCNGKERVTWGLIPHKTSWDGGKARNGYPDALYLREVCTVLKKLGIA